jgi:hypothetical protein
MIGKWMAMLVSARASNAPPPAADRAPTLNIACRPGRIGRRKTRSTCVPWVLIATSTKVFAKPNAVMVPTRPGGPAANGIKASAAPKATSAPGAYDGCRSTDDGAGAGNAHKGADHEAREDDSELVGGEVKPILNRGHARGDCAERGPRDEEAGTDSQSLAACRWRADAEHPTQIGATHA